MCAGLLPTLLLFLAALASAAPAAAQTPADVPTAADAAPAEEDEALQPVVGRIALDKRGRVRISDQAILARIQIRPGVVYDQALVDRSIRLLYGSGLFERVEARSETLPSGRVLVTFDLWARSRIQAIRFTGVSESRERRLRRELESERGLFLDERRLAEDVERMEEYYQKKGFTQVDIDFRIDRAEDSPFAGVTFVIDEGPKLSIEAIDFVGNASFSDRKLRGQMQTTTWKWYLSWLTSGGRFDEFTFQEDLERLRVFYLNEGYLDVSIPEAEVTLEYPEPSELVITIRVDEGRQYRVGTISFEGNELFTDLQLYFQLNLLPGDIFSPETLDTDVTRLRDSYGSVGYLDARVIPDRRANLETGNIDLVYRIVEGERFEVESILVEGNTKTKSIVILRELALQPGRPFNLVFMKNSEARLRNTRFFETVNLSDEPTNIPGRRNLKVRVREGRTGNIQFGAGFSSLENATLFFELTQSNFDLFKWRSPFLQGDGQRFRFLAQIGSRSNEVVISFEEPWLFERRLLFGVELFRRESEFNSSVYDELRTGIRLYLRRRLFGLVDGQLTYTLERVNIDLQSPNAALVIREEAALSPRTVSKVDFTLLRDTRNDLIFTTRGSRVQLTTTFAGLGGSTDYLGFEGRSAWFVPTFEFGDQVISILGRAGTLWPFNERESGNVPFFDRHYLGGPSTLRGFDFRRVGPREGALNEPVGGNSYAFGSAEYSIKIADPLRVAVFYDWGYVNRDEFDFDPSDYNDNWGFGIRLLVLGNPLQLDYALPMTSGYFDELQNRFIDNDEGGQFNFRFGTRF